MDWAIVWILARAYIGPADLVTHYAVRYQVEPDYAACIVRRESDWDPLAVNGDQVGPWQWKIESFYQVRRAMGLLEIDLRTDWAASTEAAMYAMGRLDLWHWWSTRSLCLQE